jgi:hypothetical protein
MLTKGSVLRELYYAFILLNVSREGVTCIQMTKVIMYNFGDVGFSTMKLFLREGRCHASHRGGPGSPQGQSMWDLLGIKSHWDRVFSKFFGFSLSVSFHCGSPYSHIIWGMNNRLLVAAVQRCLIPST